MQRRAGRKQQLKRIPMQAVVRVLLTLILLVAAVFLSYDLARYYLYSPWTRDARVRANVVTVAPDVVNDASPTTEPSAS
jgi:multidrug resistance efflux pump